VSEIASLSAANLIASGLPQRVATTEHHGFQVGGRLKRTQQRAVGQAVSTVLNQLVKVVLASVIVCCRYSVEWMCVFDLGRSAYFSFLFFVSFIFFAFF
jgi:hypothetical protein